MAQTPPLTADTKTLFAEAEIRAERTVAVLRMIMSSTLAIVFVVAVLPSAGDVGPTLMWQLVWAAITMVGYFALGAASFTAIRLGKYRPWMAWPVVTGDCLFVLFNVWATLSNTGLSANYIIALPPIWLVPVILAVGALRFNPLLQAYVAGLLIAGLIGIAVIVPGWEWSVDVLPVQDVGFLFSGPPSIMRMVMLALAGMVLVIASIRARALLARAIGETQRSVNLTRYLPQQVADRLAEDGIEALRRGTRQNVAVLFVDIRGFTALSETMSPEAISSFIADYRGRITQAVEAAGGSIDKFLGDGAMVVFGLVPGPGNEAQAALDCADRILENLRTWREGEGSPTVGLGLHWGEAFCGAVGDERRLEYAVLGDTVNVAARLEELTKEVAWPVIASEALLSRAGAIDGEGWERIDDVTLRGRNEAITLFGRGG